MLVKTHLIVTDQYDNYTVKWTGRIKDCNVELNKDNLPVFVILSKNKRIEMPTLDIAAVEKTAKRISEPRGRGALTTDKVFIYVKEHGGEEKLLGSVVHDHIRKYAPMFDEV